MFARMRQMTADTMSNTKMFYAPDVFASKSNSSCTWARTGLRHAPTMRIAHARTELPIISGESVYVSPKELQDRWRCSRSSVDRIARRAGLTRMCLGEGRNGIVRFVRKEVEAYEAQRRA